MLLLHGALNLITCIALIELVAAINSLYSSLGNPVLPGWVASGGDPCGEGWQGVGCEVSGITSMYGNASFDPLSQLPFLDIYNINLSYDFCFYLNAGFYRVLNGANLGGELGNDLGMFTSIRSM